MISTRTILSTAEMVKLNTSDVKKRQNRDAFIPSMEQINADKITQVSIRFDAKTLISSFLISLLILDLAEVLGILFVR